MRSYEKATSRPHGYLMLDLKPTTDDQLRLKTNVLPEENTSDDQYQVTSNVIPYENTADQQNLSRYIRKQSYQQSPILNAMYNSDEQMRNIMQAPQLPPDVKNILYSNELHRFQSFQNQLQNQLHFQSNLQNQLQSFLTSATNSLAKSSKKPRSSHEPLDQPTQTHVVASNPQSPAYPPGIPATPKAYFLTPPPTVEHPHERHWHTGDTDEDETGDSDEESDSEKVEELDGNDPDNKDEDSDEARDYNRQDSDHYIKSIPRTKTLTPSVKANVRYYLRNVRNVNPYDTNADKSDSDEKDPDGYDYINLTARNQNPRIIRLPKNRYHMRSKPY